jgi:hypothetical protein
MERRSASVPRAVEPAAMTTTVGGASGAPLVERTGISSSEFIEATDDGEPRQENKVAPAKRYGTVQQAAAESCSTASVEGLSRQIIEQARCIKPSGLVPLPTRSNLALASNVFPYLELEARDHLLRALETHASGKMTINSALRTVAQQYLVSRWTDEKRCGVQLTSRPGESNHEVGAALDIAEPGRWRSALEEQGFRWLGTSDRVHFDYKGGGGPLSVATDVLAFQILWNRNHPKEWILPDGHYSPGTEQCLRRAPPDGFRNGPSCSEVATPRHL